MKKVIRRAAIALVALLIVIAAVAGGALWMGERKLVRQVDVRAPTRCACLNRYSRHFRIDVLDPDPNSPLIDSAFNRLNRIRLGVKGTFIDQHPIITHNLLGCLRHLVNRTFIAALYLVLDKGHTRRFPLVHSADASRYRQHRSN